MHDVYLGLGTNLGDKAENLNTAIKYIEERVGRLIACSAFFVTDPVGFDSDNQFLNAACHIQTELSPVEVLDLTQEIERLMGRTHKSVNKVYSDRVIDIDLLLFDDLIESDDRLVLPHPYMHEREFVMKPLQEIASDYLHPVLNKTIAELAHKL